MSYEIHPDTPPQGVKLERLFAPGYRHMQDGLATRCRELGLPFQTPAVLSNSRHAIEAAEFARDAGLHPAFHRAVLAAFFARSLDIGEVEVLRGIAKDVGLDGPALVDALATGRYSGKRVAAEEEARTLGVTAVPTFIFEGAARVVGAQPLGYFQRLLGSMSAGESG